jgi:GNAT superfamily N-acetyltransferase
VPGSFEVSPARALDDLRGILALQQQNLAANVSAAEAVAQGFVTVAHTLESLEAMHALAPSIVARAVSESGVSSAPREVVGYALTMAVEARALVPILEPMFQKLSALTWRGRSLSSLRHYVMGQVCVAKAFRGQGVFDALYRGHEQAYRERFDLIVTEIATRNTRSLRAHERVGFEPISRYRDETDEWIIVGWDWSGSTAAAP